MLVLLDTNVLLRALEPGHSHHGDAVQALRRLRRDDHVPCVVPQVHYEFWVAATRPLALNGLGMSAAEARAELLRLGPPLFRLLRDERAIYDKWRDLIEKYGAQGKQAHDARIVPAMVRHEVTHLLTFNGGDFQRYTEITLIDPRTNSMRSTDPI